MTELDENGRRVSAFDASWYIFADDQAKGPFTGHELRQLRERGCLTSETFVCPMGAEELVHAGLDPVLKSLFAFDQQPASREASTSTTRRPIASHAASVIWPGAMLGGFAIGIAGTVLKITGILCFISSIFTKHIAARILIAVAIFVVGAACSRLSRHSAQLRK